MADALQERVAALAKQPPKYAPTNNRGTLERSIRREWWTILVNGVATEVLFCPPQAIVEIEKNWPVYRGKIVS